MNKHLDDIKKFEQPTTHDRTHDMFRFVVFDKKNEEGANYYFIPNKSEISSIRKIYQTSYCFLDLVDPEPLKRKKYVNAFYFRAISGKDRSIETYVKIVEEMAKEGDVIVDNEKDWAEIMKYVSEVTGKTEQVL